MISNEAKLVDHCPKTPPSREPRSVDDEAERPPVASMCGSTAFASFTKSSFSIADFGCTCGMECSVSRLYSIMYRSFTIVAGPRAELTDGVMRTFRLRNLGPVGSSSPRGWVQRHYRVQTTARRRRASEHRDTCVCPPLPKDHDHDEEV